MAFEIGYAPLESGYAALQDHYLIKCLVQVANVVGGHDHVHRPTKLHEKIMESAALSGVETDRRLVKQEKFRAVNERLGDRQSLLLASGQGVHLVIHLRCQPDAFNHCGSGSPGVPLPHTFEPSDICDLFPACQSREGGAALREP